MTLMTFFGPRFVAPGGKSLNQDPEYYHSEPQTDTVVAWQPATRRCGMRDMESSSPRSPTPALGSFGMPSAQDDDSEGDGSEDERAGSSAASESLGESGTVVRRNHFDWSNPESDGGRRTLAVCRALMNTKVKGSDRMKGIFDSRVKTRVCEEAAAKIIKEDEKASSGKPLFHSLSGLQTRKFWDRALALAHAYKDNPDEGGMSQMYQEILRQEADHAQRMKSLDEQAQLESRVKESRVNTALERAGQAKKRCTGGVAFGTQSSGTGIHDQPLPTTTVSQVVHLMYVQEEYLIHMCTHSCWGDKAMRARMHCLNTQLLNLELHSPELFQSAAAEYRRRL